MKTPFTKGAVVLALAGLALATARAETNPAAASKIPAADRSFVEKAAGGGLAEVELGRLAQRKAANEQVKKFGARMARDHARANAELERLASAKGVKVPTAPDRAHQRDIDRLGKLSGADFDREYMKHMVIDHRKDVKEFQKQSQDARDADVKGFAGKTLPTLEEHLKLAQATQDALVGVTRDKDGIGKGASAGGETPAPEAKSPR